ncbi:hypothetical protein SAY87_005518 [Trapa incisa]|uniref:Uncharacterized protein n=1 Tax=Trapa incisa TaxID=236973 RepID=A0AAN7QBV1_9MYRT|nr:hypothetical protein SAY87_005518 [Trapa incisa]
MLITASTLQCYLRLETCPRSIQQIDQVKKMEFADSTRNRVAGNEHFEPLRAVKRHHNQAGVDATMTPRLKYCTATTATRFKPRAHYAPCQVVVSIGRGVQC